MFADTYISLQGPSEGRYKEKGSKFLSFAYPVASEEEVKAKLDALKKEYHDARHHCYAYILGVDQTIQKANDAGEPRHSAGDPILGQIRAAKLSNVLIVVIRYFGGTKLGISGLIRAYKTAAADALAHNKVLEKIVKEPLSLHFDYAVMNHIMKLVKDYQLEVLVQSFTNQCFMKLQVRQGAKEVVLAKLKEIEGVSVEV